MIEFFSENDYSLKQKKKVVAWLTEVIELEGKEPGEISYVFCSDEYLIEINRNFLDHDTYTDIISFDYSLGNEINGEVYISTERVKENAATFRVDYQEELHRVMVHGILHFCGHNDKTEDESESMRELENRYLALRDFA